MLNIEIDGVYCKECNCLHPTLFWHEFYDDYIKTKEEFTVNIKETAKRFNKEITDEEATELYYENMKIRELACSAESGECVICKTKTHYRLAKANKYVCSDQCRYKAR